jgi:hypothetical protein
MNQSVEKRIWAWGNLTKQIWHLSVLSNLHTLHPSVVATNFAERCNSTTPRSDTTLVLSFTKLSNPGASAALHSDCWHETMRAWMQSLHLNAGYKATKNRKSELKLRTSLSAPASVDTHGLTRNRRRKMHIIWRLRSAECRLPTTRLAQVIGTRGLHCSIATSKLPSIVRLAHDFFMFARSIHQSISWWSIVSPFQMSAL